MEKMNADLPKYLNSCLQSFKLSKLLCAFNCGNTQMQHLIKVGGWSSDLCV